ncbi:MAG: hypothetical protein KF898_07180 [Parachlamydiales bacterium]|nr:hypothetical protein [Candidatus Acheromyda pituitae]
MASVSSPNFSNVTFDQVRQATFQGAKQAYESQAKAFANAEEKLKGFQTDIDARIGALQESKDTSSIPAEDALLQEAIGYVSTYDELFQTALKAKVLSEGMRNAIEFLTPKPRAYADQTLLDQRGGELSAEVAKANETCVQYVKELGELWGQADFLQKKMIAQLQTATAGSVQMFCQIVDNKGLPLGYWTRTVDNWTTPVVPKKADLEAKLEALTKKAEASPSGEGREIKAETGT